MTVKEGGVKLHTRNLGITFGTTEVLTDINFQAEPGEFVAIVGRSGCGKSTLLRLVAGLEKPSDGLIMIEGNATKGIHPDIRVLFQDSRLLPWRKAVDNVRIGVKSGDKKLAHEALKQVGLEERAGAWPAVLSGGQRQRVALARALAGSPRLLLLDEPLGALDALTRIEMQQLIERLWSEQRFTVLLVTHDVSEAVALADRVVLIESGKIAMDVKITLPRPRERDSGFAYFEKVILDRLLLKEPGAIEAQRELSFSI
ncbi:ATP-binding cassette domain-containing protein [Paenibacillus validus]|uniref:ATP-binding cassette domain-containing protein n=1 Tax=Paenibacillus validus TaxID=44253 RepID=A0A7X2ZAS0_9BACL|nr:MULTISPECIES: ATP-binding cassette domain-containing protein [Paenibacillus]MED4601711.1 ATP-binding cassette domain-containing protein [Paenibacillus validus]MED4608749.1 ATP-binding cassette domain-containing protein [Paenibacillus validus]MUG71391.1 ATP-binding cassette domain-containing protein [Paenibacillus validus]